MRIRAASIAIAVAACGAGARAEPPASRPAVVPCAGPGPPDMACVPGGEFLRGSDDGPPSTRPRARVFLQTFYLDRTEVTVGEYQACVRARRCEPARTVYEDFSRPRQPKVGVSWYHALRFCRAAGKHLPTEAEWEKAARGSDGRLHPWGDEPATCARAVIMDASGRSCGVRKSGKNPEKGRTLEVGRRPPGLYGIHDLMGNAWEWVNDWYSPSYARCGAACRGVDPRGPCAGREPCRGHTLRVVRGGSWYWPAAMATAIYRRAHVPSNRPYHHYGFRCAASPAEVAARSAREEAPKASRARSEATKDSAR